MATSRHIPLGRHPGIRPHPRANLTRVADRQLRFRAIRRAAALATVALALTGGIQANDAGAASRTTSTTTTTKAAGLTLKAWKNRYESAVGVIVGDIFVVENTGAKQADHPTRKGVQEAVSHCQKWHGNATRIPGKVPAIPLASAQESWSDLIHASIAASSGCITALEHGSRSAGSSFLSNLARAETYGHRLIRQLGSPAG
ncbi:MAG: hypothetical protein ACLP62_13710 [Acidimicrobiales bacterium]